VKRRNISQRQNGVGEHAGTEIRSCVKVKRRKTAGKTSHLAANLQQCNFNATKLKEKWMRDVTELRMGVRNFIFLLWWI
jgi:integrase, catalytic region